MAETQAAKRLREYETIFLVKPDLTDDNVDKLKERVRGIVDREGGKVLRFTVWGKKKTLFPVAKQPRAIYVHASYLGGSKLVAEIERNLKNLDEVTRYISVKKADEVDPDTRPVLEDLKLAGDVEETRPGAPADREGGFRGDGGEEAVGESEEESSEEA
ncbi:30S ribosomal protein S6 [Myxococcus sp. MISCRS1]|uniref:Small ribosomal subunit protein bS6 n=1 Tax=Myxococcus fulvus TaxID=33 RepID=A0A511T492_MYXFU|nr:MULTISPECIES: 30S ribosomal protein S6 [Myxococcus]AKF82786.1 30S ribosomal protein S6 [Myxococcus fulvus 124B02]BDT36225.1 30S ribosomal protein S6 [Myxococcus sp. MH1]MBZ4398747.1 30S ribosomal protein S6 [Myxococcus sp. AS-1-15]MBZ4407007.1 30S ribosomal protein S6 [Myxococcus sp. XM-1-1-1]MCK8502686.1 30S ribosomal protein S6 [Myxococcus fulvus]